MFLNRQSAEISLNCPTNFAGPHQSSSNIETQTATLQNIAEILNQRANTWRILIFQIWNSTVWVLLSSMGPALWAPLRNPLLSCRQLLHLCFISLYQLFQSFFCSGGKSTENIMWPHCTTCQWFTVALISMDVLVINSCEGEHWDPLMLCLLMGAICSPPALQIPFSHLQSISWILRFYSPSSSSPSPPVSIFVISFTTAEFWKTKFYTPKLLKN